jgi:hypothetical protein
MNIATVSESQLTSKALKISRCKVWSVVVDLKNNDGSTLSWKRKYQIACKIIGVGSVEIRAQSLLTGTQISCKVDEVKAQG